MSDDYGIDRQVEIFDDTGRSTGLVFNLQLKATDEPDLALALRRTRFPRETADYYRSLRLPVLVVLFHAPTGGQFSRWFHQSQRHVAARSVSPSVSGSELFPFEREDIWTEATPAQLEQGVRGFGIFRDPGLRLPLTLVVDTTSEQPFVEPHAVAFTLRRAFEAVPDVVSVVQGTSRLDEPSVVFHATSFAVRLGDVAEVTVDVDLESNAAQEHIAHDIATALAFVLHKVGQANVAAQLAAQFATDSGVIVDPDVSWSIARSMYRSGRIRESIDLADALDSTNDEDLQTAGFAFLSVLLAHRRELSEVDRSRTLECAERRFQRRRDKGDSPGAAAERYSHGMLHKRLRDPDSAISSFEQAAALDPTYLDRPYFHSDLGGALFEGHRYRDAAKSYGRAVALGSDGLSRALLADSMMLSGDYLDAERQFGLFLRRSSSRADAEWRLKLAVLPSIRSLVGDKQDRQPDAAAECVAHVDFESDVDLAAEQAWELIDQGIRLDACCAEAWFRRAILLLAEPDAPRSSAASALTAALLHRSNSGAWTNALLTADPSNAAQLSDIAHTGYRFCGVDFADAAIAASLSSSLPLTPQRAVELLDAAAQDLERAKQHESLTMRFNSPGGVVREVSFERSEFS